MIKITGLMEMLWSAKEGMLVKAEADMLKAMGLVVEMRGSAQGDALYALTAKGEKILTQGEGNQQLLAAA